MAKYATLSKYRPYIEVICRDLNLPADLFIDFKFASFNGVVGGYAQWRDTWAVIRLHNAGGHQWTVKAIMHELKHVQQYYTKRLDWQYVPAQYDDNGKKRYNTGKWMQLWDGELYSAYRSSKNNKIQKLYLQQPWEIEARVYEQEVEHLFPFYQIRRQYLGKASDGVKFYKTGYSNGK